VRGAIRPRGVLGFFLAVAILLAVPATALAGEGYDLSFRFTAGDGYRITVGGYDATALITAAKPDPTHGRYAWSTYVARGKVSPTAIHASFGALGHADMRFQQSGAVTYGKRHHHCVGADRYTIRRGVFVGTVRFRGEGGYVSAKVHRVKGKVVTPRSLTCFDSLFEELEKFERGGGGHGTKEKPKVTRLRSFLRSGLTAIYFVASERGGKTQFTAEMEQTIGPLGVFRGVSTHASPATFASDKALSSAAITPPPPFNGSGIFERGPTGKKSLTGSLAVSFPGAPNVPLVDPRFKTQLTRSW
jgi:hypothetical protein